MIEPSQVPFESRPAKLWQSTEACRRDRVRQKLSQANLRANCFLHKARPPRPSEPILIPKLRIQFADFPYLHYSIDQRLLTLETCCGYEYDLARFRRNLTRIFKVPLNTRGCNGNCCTLRRTKTLSPLEGIPGLRWLMQKRQLFPELERASPSQFALPRRTKVRSVP